KHSPSRRTSLHFLLFACTSGSIFPRYMSLFCAHTGLFTCENHRVFPENRNMTGATRKLLIASALFTLLLFFAGCGGNAGISAGSGASGGSGSGGGAGSGGGSGSGGSGGSGGGSTTPNTSCAMTAGQGASLNGFVPFTSDSPWNQDISSAAVDPNSSQIINFIGPTIGLHPDFGSGQYQGSTIGIPYTVVDGTQAPVSINFNQSADESDPGPMPIPASAPIEGYPNPGNGDRHVLVLDNNN